MSGYLTRDASMKHYGVPGMRWGHRKARGTSTSAPAATTAEPKSNPNVQRSLQVGKKAALTTIKVAGAVTVASLAGMPLAVGGLMWKEWGYTPLDLIQNRPFLEDV